MMKKKTAGKTVHAGSGLQPANGFLLCGLGWLTMVIGLFAATWIGHLAERAGSPSALADVLRGIVVTSIVAPIAFRLRGRFPIPLCLLPLSKTGIANLLGGAGLPILLAGCGFGLAVQLGWIDILEWHGSFSLAAAVLGNALVAFLYEALPEELTLRGLVYSGLRTKLPAFAAYVGQIALFVCVPVAVNGLQRLSGMAPGVEIHADYVVLLLAFGTVLQLLRGCTGALWASVGFHLAFLEISRFVVTQNEVRLFTYAERVEGTGPFFILFAMVILGGILVAGAVRLWQMARLKKAKP